MPSKIFRDFLERSKAEKLEAMYAQDIEVKCTIEIQRAMSRTMDLLFKREL